MNLTFFTTRIFISLQQLQSFLFLAKVVYVLCSPLQSNHFSHAHFYHSYQSVRRRRPAFLTVGTPWKKWFGVRQIIKAKKEVWANRCRCDSHLSVQLFSKQSQWGLTRVLNSQLYVTTEFYPYMCIIGWLSNNNVLSWLFQICLKLIYIVFFIWSSSNISNKACVDREPYNKNYSKSITILKDSKWLSC